MTPHLLEWIEPPDVWDTPTEPDDPVCPQCGDEACNGRRCPDLLDTATEKDPQK